MVLSFFFFNDTATTEIYTLSLHDALPISAVVWLDALMLNVDRTPRNPNLLVWHGRLWLIDFGAALYVQHGTSDLAAEAGRSFAAIREHVLLPHAGPVLEADERLAARVPDLDALAAQVPEEWIGDPA